jgi:hypothetical protein
MKGHTGGTMSMGKGCIYSTLVKQKLVTRSSAAVDRTLRYGAGIQSQGIIAVPGQDEFNSHREEWSELVHKAYATYKISAISLSRIKWTRNV